jgi:hypothetical protein
MVGGENDIQGKNGKMFFDPEAVSYVSTLEGEVYRFNGSNYQLFANSPIPNGWVNYGMDFEFSPEGILFGIITNLEISSNQTKLRIVKLLDGEWQTVTEKIFPRLYPYTDIVFSPSGELHFSYDSRIYKLIGDQIALLNIVNINSDRFDNSFHFNENGDLIFIEGVTFSSGLRMVRYNPMSYTTDSLFSVSANSLPPTSVGNEPPICFPQEPFGILKKGLEDRFFLIFSSLLPMIETYIHFSGANQPQTNPQNFQPNGLVSLYEMDESGKMISLNPSGKTRRLENQSWQPISDTIPTQSNNLVFNIKFSPDHKVLYALVGSQSKTLVYALNVVTSTKSSIPESKAALFPNPAKNSISLTSPQLENQSNLQIFDVHGKLVKEIEGTNDQNTFSVEGLIPGVYMLRFMEDGQSKNFRFVKE